jgi:CTP:molybdopterin cytidylyltransferase MocA
VYVVLAAGGSRRMGFPKVTAPLAGRSPIERLGGMLAGRSLAIVTTELQQAACSRALPWALVLHNRAPHLGMTSSLLVAHHALDPEATLGVMLADKPFVRKETLELCERALEEGAGDVLVATAGGKLGHPVYFGPKARARLSAAPAGDTLRAVRDDPGLRQTTVECADPGILIDLDTPAAWRTAERKLQSERTRA